ncbi:uncharacterized protein [Rutidosis leptorrhynchoides]|uniref:uncharacterized protein n=1 Tax=Rutidosis leptorrhynchoides TaxID=125765 RepID=UPI003A990BD3
MAQPNFQSPLYLHPSDGPSSLAIQEKLSGAQNYRSWRKSMEIALSSKRKIGFVTGTVVRSGANTNEAELWDTCNNMVISWIMSSVVDQIAKSIMFVGTAAEIWTQLEKRFALSSGSRKYKLHKETYSIEQQDVVALLSAINLQKEEQHLFQFLNGLDDHFSALRSQLLLISPLPSVETACSMLQQEESQREMFNASETTTLYSKLTQKDKEKCSIFGFRWHPPERCWEKVGYPPWNS